MRCPDCAQEYLLAFSCKTRDLCPSCAAKRSAATAALLADEVFQPVGHAQWVLTVPKMLRPYFLHHRELLGPLARAAWQTALEMIRAAAADDELQPGMVGVVQTAGDLANWHPHVHALVSRGGWTRDWQWVGVPYVDERSAELLFRHKVLRLLQDEGLLSEERTNLLLSWRHTGFSVHTQVRVEPEDSQALERLTRYILRSPVSLERMRWNGVGDVRYRRKSGHDGAGPFAGAEETFDPLDFLARVIMHIPAPRRHLVRYYGAYSNAARGRRRRASEIGSRDELHATETGASDLDAKTLRRRWATLIKRVYQVDPLICPACGAEMRIIAFIVDPDVVDAILRHISPPSAHQPSRAPPQGERLATVS